MGTFCSLKHPVRMNLTNTGRPWDEHRETPSNTRLQGLREAWEMYVQSLGCSDPQGLCVLHFYNPNTMFVTHWCFQSK